MENIMKTLHTLGPWNCNRASAGGREIIVSEVCTKDIAVLSHRDKTIAEINANAMLIAAAPDLLQALKQMLDAFYHDPLGGGQDAAIEAALDAVAKVEGEK